MTVRPDVVLVRLGQLEHALAMLDRLRTGPHSDRADPVIRLALERALHIAAEAVFDIGHHVLAGRGLPVPSKYRAIVPALATGGIISHELAGRLTGLAGLRNVLVHDYAVVDHAVLWALADDRLDDLREASAAYAALPELATGP